MATTHENYRAVQGICVSSSETGPLLDKTTKNDSSVNKFTNNVISCICNNQLLAKLWALFFFVDGAWIGFSPISAASSTGLDIDESGGAGGGEGEAVEGEDGATLQDTAIISFLIRAIGFAMMNDGATAFLATTDGVTVDRAIGVGLLFRIAFFGREVLAGTFHDLHMNVTYMTSASILILVGTVPLLTNQCCQSVVARVMTLVIGIMAIRRFVDPVQASKLELGIDVSGDAMLRTKEFVRDLAMEDFVGVVLMVTLAFGSFPVKSIGYASLIWPLYIFYICILSPQIRVILGFTDAGPLVFYFVFAAFFALKFLLT